MPHSSQIQDEVDALYDLRPGEFVAARDALAKQVRHGGDRAEAERIKGLARPSAAAWAVNQLARREPEWTQALTTAGRRMAEAHTSLLEDGDRDGWRKASAEAREAIERLVRLAEGLLREERGSVSAQLREQVRDTLQAAATDPAARELVSSGRLSRDLRPPGGLPDLPTGRFARPAAPRPGATSPRGPSADSDRFQRPTGAAAEREARAARRAAERDARGQLRRAEKERTTAQVASERAEQALLRARKAREAAAAELATAQRADEQRAKELQAAEDAFAEARAQLEARDAAVCEIRDELDQLADPADDA